MLALKTSRGSPGIRHFANFGARTSLSFDTTFPLRRLFHTTFSEDTSWKELRGVQTHRHSSSFVCQSSAALSRVPLLDSWRGVNTIVHWRYLKNIASKTTMKAAASKDSASGGDISGSERQTVSIRTVFCNLYCLPVIFPCTT